MPIFRAKCVKIYTGQKKFTRTPSARPRQISGTYLIFVISFTQTGFSKTKFYTQKMTKGTKNTKNVSQKVKKMHFFTQSGKGLR